METDNGPNIVIVKREEGCVDMRNSSVIAEKVATLYRDKLMCDVVLVMNGIEFPAHRLILCTSSQVFASMLLNDRWSESKLQEIVFHESPPCAQVFGLFLKYLYTGEVTFVIDNVIYLLELADKYDIKDLTHLCIQYMEKHMPLAATSHQIIVWFKYTALHNGHDALAKMCQNLIEWNISGIHHANDFIHLEPEQICSILSSDDLVVTNEFTLFTYVVKWINGQQIRFEDMDEDEHRALMQHVLSYIRYPMMSPRQVADLLLIPLTQNYKEFLMDQMAISMWFHAGAFDKLNNAIESHPNQLKLFTPRLYIADHWSIPIVIDNFAEFPLYQSTTTVFSTPVSFADHQSTNQIEWVADFYPKGVRFGEYGLIAWETQPCPGHVNPTVRLAVRCKHDQPELIRVQVSILVFATENGVDHVRFIHKRRVCFSQSETLVNIDNILPYEEWVWPAGQGNGPDKEKLFLCGDNHDAVNVQIVITPLTNYDAN